MATVVHTRRSVTLFKGPWGMALPSCTVHETAGIPGSNCKVGTAFQNWADCHWVWMWTHTGYLALRVALFPGWQSTGPAKHTKTYTQRSRQHPAPQQTNRKQACYQILMYIYLQNLKSRNLSPNYKKCLSPWSRVTGEGPYTVIFLFLGVQPHTAQMDTIFFKVIWQMYQKLKSACLLSCHLLQGPVSHWLCWGGPVLNDCLPW